MLPSRRFPLTERFVGVEGTEFELEFKNGNNSEFSFKSLDDFKFEMFIIELKLVIDASFKVELVLNVFVVKLLNELKKF